MRLHPSDTASEPSIPEESSPDRMKSGPSPVGRRLVWGALIALLIALAALALPLINANRYRGQIAQTMSASLGRPVHLDNVSLHLLPVPGFTLQNFVVSEDPDFGSEPTVRADSVEATLRVSSLWRRPVEFSTVRFVNPSVNLVRNAEGRWNLSEVLLHASRVDSAPTGQRRAGPAPRFPYVEATGGRVNVKMGVEKLPFSLTDADFALWLPSSQQWRVRLIGHPARTDTDITDPGTVRVEGELRRADTAAAVPVNFHASWHAAPLGEATRVLSGDDWGWRGSVNLDVALSGTLGSARLASKLTLGGLRRAEFFPARPLDLQITCGSGFTVQPGLLRGLTCTMPDDAAEPLTFTADALSLQTGQADSASLQGKGIPMRWALLWASLFSSRVPTDLHPKGVVDVALTRGTAAPVPPTAPKRKHLPRVPVPQVERKGRTWSGTVEMLVPVDGGGGTAAEPAAAEPTNDLVWRLQPVEPDRNVLQLRLDPTPVRLGPNAAVSVSGNVGPAGYVLNVNGNAPAAALLVPARYLPQLGDGLEKVLPYPPTGIDAARVEFSCTHPWGASQSCKGLEPAGAPRGLSAPPMTGTPRQTPALLTPRSLSPYDYPRTGAPR